jgi:hypothetical protein
MASMAELARQRLEGRKLLDDIAKERSAAVRDITGRYNYRFLVVIRREFCIRANDLGIGATSIAKVLQRHHGTVLYHLRPEMRARKRAQRLRWAAANPRVRPAPQGEVYHAG